MADRSRYVDDFHIAGMKYWDGALVLGKLKPGKKLRLVPEPDNPHDPDAVAIWRKDVKLGYVPHDKNALMAQMFWFGHGDVLECRVLAVDEEAEPWEQVRVGIYVTDGREEAQDGRH